MHQTNLHVVHLVFLAPFHGAVSLQQPLPAAPAGHHLHLARATVRVASLAVELAELRASRAHVGHDGRQRRGGACPPSCTATGT